jgi:spore germination protein KB
MTRSISSLQLYMLVIITVAVNCHVTLIPLLIESAGRDAWISLFISFITLLPFILIILYIQRTTQSGEVLTWIQQRYGFTHVVLRVIVIIWLLCTAAISLKDVVNWANVSFLQLTPPYTLSILFTLTCYFSALKGLRTLAIVTGVLLPIVSSLGFFVAIFNHPEKDYSLLLPILEHGFQPILRGVGFANAAILESAMMIFLLHHTRGTLKARHLVLLLFILVGLTIGPTIASIAEYGYEEAVKQRFPAYEQWRLFQLGRYIGHLDFMAIFQWLSGAFIRIALAIFLMVDVVGIKKQKLRHTYVAISALVVLSVSLIPITDTQFTQVLRSYAHISLITMLLVLSTIFGLCIFGKRRGSA